MIVVIVSAAGSFVIVGLNGLVFNSEALVLLGVACASINGGLGELTFLALSARYDKSTISAWSAGTGEEIVLCLCMYI